MITLNPVSQDFPFKPHQVLVERQAHWQAVVCHVQKTSAQSLWRRMLKLPACEVEQIYLLEPSGRISKHGRQDLCRRFAFRGKRLSDEVFTDLLLDNILRHRQSAWWRMCRWLNDRRIPANLAQDIIELEAEFDQAAQKNEHRQYQLGLCSQ